MFGAVGTETHLSKMKAPPEGGVISIQRRNKSDFMRLVTVQTTKEPSGFNLQELKIGSLAGSLNAAPKMEAKRSAMWFAMRG